jgi:hypothetical protein
MYDRYRQVVLYPLVSPCFLLSVFISLSLGWALVLFVNVAFTTSHYMWSMLAIMQKWHHGRRCHLKAKSCSIVTSRERRYTFR